MANKCFRSEERRKMRGRLNSLRPERERMRDKGSSLVKMVASGFRREGEIKPFSSFGGQMFVQKFINASGYY